MKQLISLCLCASVLNLSAAVPLRWTVETSRAQPATFEAYQGETIDFEAALTSYGKPLEAPSNYSLYWQTNGMGNAFWSVPCTPPNSNTLNSNNSNTLFATWSPTNDVGARVYNCFIGQPGTIYHAAFQLRLRPSPGALPNELPLPQKVIDFAKVTVLNPPWSGGGGGGGVDTNAVRDIVREQLATNGIRAVDGAARPLPKYLHTYNADDSYPDAAAEYYRQRGSGVPAASCSSVRDGGFLYRNFDYPFDDRAVFVVHMSSGPARFASVGVAQVGTNLTEQMVTSGEWSKWYKALPGATVDGINENGVCAEVNVVDGEVDPDEWTGADNLHPLAAVRWVLDNATNALHAAKYLKENIKWPEGWMQNFHWMIADETETYILENGDYHSVTGRAVMTNFPLYPAPVFGSGWERYKLLTTNLTASITNVWFTRAYADDTDWLSEFSSREEMNAAKIAWDNGQTKEQHRGQHDGNKWWWQTVHTSVYDLTNRVLRVAVQEVDDWYVFQVPSAGVDEAKVREIVEDVVAPVASQVSGLQSSKAGVDEQGFLDQRVKYIGETEYGPFIDIDNGLINGDLEVYGDITSYGDVVTANNSLNGLSSYVHNTLDPQVSAKANRPVSWNPTHADNIAALDENGNLKDSNIGTDERGIKIEASGGITSVQLNDGGIYIESYNPGAGEVTVVDNSSGPSVRHDLSAKADRSMISATDQTFSNEVLKVQMLSLSTNITAEVYIAATNACANLGIDPALIPGAGTTGTVGGFIAMLFVVVFWMRKKIFDTSGKVNDTFAGELLGKQVAISAMHYDKYLVLTEGADAWKLHDRAENRLVFTASTTHTFDFTANAPTEVTGKCRDFLLDIVTDAAVDFTTTGATIKGDSLDIAGQGEYLIAVTERYDGSWYVRNIEMKDPQ